MQTQSDSERFLQNLVISPREVAQYNIDDGRTLRAQKENISILLSAWEKRTVSIDEFTLCPSGSAASFATLAVMHELGSDHILFETPCFYGTVEQAELLNMKIHLLPTFARDAYRLPIPKHWQRSKISSILWLTQPRASLGFNQDIDLLQSIIQYGYFRFLVIDEVTDQTFPSLLNSLSVQFPESNIVRIRSFTKPMGLNGVRISAIMHPPSMRNAFRNSLELFGATLDAYSLRVVQKLGEDIGRFNLMLGAANAQVVRLRKRVEKMARASAITVNPLVNGYIGSMVADLSALGKNQNARRRHLLTACRSMRMPVILGSAFYVAKDPPLEAIRLNFFMHPEHIIRAVANMLRVTSAN
jgi:histidinol-phosphate/aromatic aminotransferase/cobyric acid decarboxylase-like protein